MYDVQLPYLDMFFEDPVAHFGADAVTDSPHPVSIEQWVSQFNYKYYQKRSNRFDQLFDHENSPAELSLSKDAKRLFLSFEDYEEFTNANIPNTYFIGYYSGTVI